MLAKNEVPVSTLSTKSRFTRTKGEIERKDIRSRVEDSIFFVQLLRSYFCVPLPIRLTELLSYSGDDLSEREQRDAP